MEENDRDSFYLLKYIIVQIGTKYIAFIFENDMINIRSSVRKENELWKS